VPVSYIPKPIRAVITTPVRALCANQMDFTNVYQNTTLRPILCVISVNCESGGAVGIGGMCRALGTTENDPNPDGDWIYFGWQSAPGNNESISGIITILVPPGWYYRVFRNEGPLQDVGLHEWVEIEL